MWKATYPLFCFRTRKTQKEETVKKPLQRREVKHVAESTIKKPAAKKADTEATAKEGK